jgi:hypothetical protein
VTRRRLARVFWLGAAAILVAAALISLVAVLKGSFSETDGRILGTLAALLYCGGAALAGFALADRGPARTLGRVVAGLSAFTFALFAAAIWEAWTYHGSPPWHLAFSSALFLLAGLVATTGLLLTRRPALQRLAAVAGGLTTLAVSLTLIPIWRDDDPGSTLAKAMGATWILAALAYLLGPVLQRWSSVGDLEGGDRVLATLDGVELVATREPGEALVVTERPRPGERLVLRRPA